MAAPLFAVCLKPVELRATVDPLSGEVLGDPYSLGYSPADEAALEWALRCAERFGGRVRALSGGGPPAEALLARAGATGASELVRVDLDPEWPSQWVAHSLAPHLAGASLVWCGDMSLDRGSGSVPACLAGELGVAQALGLLRVELPERAGAGELSLRGVRRLDGGRRELLATRGRAVVSVEGATARLRRAPLGALLSASRRQVELRTAREATVAAPALRAVAPYRPPARPVPAPAGATARERVVALTGLAHGRPASGAQRVEPSEAARHILEALKEWGELP